MPVPQAKFRELVFQLIYSQALGAASDEDMLPLMMKELAVTKKTVRQALDRVAMVRREQEFLDEQLQGASESYAYERIRLVEKAILRLGAYEILCDEEIPPKVAISEAVRLARKFSTAEAGAFVNAVLDAIYRKKQGETPDEGRLSEASAALLESEEIARQAGEESQEQES